MAMSNTTTTMRAAPHIVLTLVDDWGSADAAFREAELRPGFPPQLKTPTIDSLAAAGIVLDRYYVQHICSPTRTALLSSRYQIHTGLQDGIIQAWARVCLPTRFGTVADALSGLGYATHMVEWHAGIFKDACLPWHRGFSSYFGFLTGSEHHYTKVQRIGRGYQNGTKDFPDLRTHEGPVTSHCINDPFAPPPPPPPPCGLPSQPPCIYTVRAGYLAAGNDAVPFRMRTVAQAEADCDGLANCSAITFETATPTTCDTKPCKMYFKTAAAGTSAGGAGWETLFKHPVPPSAQGDVSCYSTHMFTAQATSIIARHNASQLQTPLFLYLALQDVHEPIEVPAQYSAPFASTIKDGTRRTYAGMVSVVDECLSNVTAALRANRNMWANTILAVSNDNGGWTGYGGLNTPFRGHKTQLWEGGIRGIGFIVAPGRLPANGRYGGLMHVTDWLPTFVSAAGGSVRSLGPRFVGIDGISQWSALTALGSRGDDGARLPTSRRAYDGAFPRTEILHNIEGVDGGGVAVLRVGPHKLVHNMRDPSFWCDACNATSCWIPPHSGPGAGAQGHFVARGGQLCCYAAPPSDTNSTASCAPVEAPPPTLPVDMLFDVDADPSERHDISSAHPEIVQSMLQRLAFYNASNVPCCICTGSGRTSEMDLPPLDGYWTSFRDQSPNPDTNCKLQAEE